MKTVLYPAIALMIGIFMGGVYGGSRTAILLNIPGAPSAIATAMDGYPMALKGEAGTAIAMENAHPKLKEIADRIAPPNTEYGVMTVLRQLFDSEES